VQDVGRRGDRVRPEDQRQPGAVRGGDEPVRERDVAGDVPVDAGRRGRRRDLVLDGEVLGRLAERPAGLERAQVGLEQLRAIAELDPQEPLRRLRGAAVQPRQRAEGEHVLRPLGLLAGEIEVLQRLDRHARQRQRVHVVGVEAAVVARVAGVTDLRQVALGELVGVEDDHGAARQVAQVRLERGGVHGDEDVRGVAGREHLVVGEVQLEAGDAGEGALRRADLRREVRQRGEVVPERSGLGGEPVARQLHAVPRIACEADDDTIDRLTGLPGHHGRGGHVRCVP
jgi:hypothetical protein